MHFKAPPISELRLQRHHRWALLWLKWFAAFLDAAGAYGPISQQARTIAHRLLDRIERLLLNIALIRAAPRVRFIKWPRTFGRTRALPPFFRTVIGGAMRRALRPKDLRQRIEALSQPIETLIARLVRRLPRGLTSARRRARPETRQPACTLARALPASSADTS